METLGVAWRSEERNFWENRPVFVTGASGLLGGWLIAALLELKSEVVILLRDWVPRSVLLSERFLDHVNVVRGDVVDQALLERALNEYEIETIFHLAAQTIVGTANRNPVSTFETNINGTWHLLEAARRCPTVNRIIVASSDKAYGDQKLLPYDESTPLQGRHPYDVSKSCADLLCQTYYTTYSLPVCVTRCGNFYGGGDLNWNRIVPGTIRSVLKNERPVIRSDGTFIRDYFYVKDGAIAYLHLARLMNNPNVVGEAFNFSNEIQLTVLDLVKLILKVMKREDLEPDIRNEASNEIKHQYLSARKAHETLGWQPRYELAKALNETVEWYKKYLGGFIKND